MSLQELALVTRHRRAILKAFALQLSEAFGKRAS